MNISISRDGVEIGEWTEEDVRTFYHEGRLVGSDLYWTEGMSAWANLSELINRRAPPPFPESAPPPPGIATMTVIQDSGPWHQWVREHGVGRLAYIGLLILIWGLTFGISYVAGYSLVGQPPGANAVSETTRFIECGFAFLTCGATWLRYINIGYSQSKAVLFSALLLLPLLGLITLGFGLIRAPNSEGKGRRSPGSAA